MKKGFSLEVSLRKNMFYYTISSPALEPTIKGPYETIEEARTRMNEFCKIFVTQLVEGMGTPKAATLENPSIYTLTSKSFRRNNTPAFFTKIIDDDCITIQYIDRDGDITMAGRLTVTPSIPAQSCNKNITFTLQGTDIFITMTYERFKREFVSCADLFESLKEAFADSFEQINHPESASLVRGGIMTWADDNDPITAFERCRPGRTYTMKIKGSLFFK